ncbi:TonB-dependent receptor [Moheibacter sediminis]|uniref:Outer membrane receptor proteins, mostly Fe transport n=1 Tax=Moheibacter sediminis TaxID=1434700 RepID=A0A1W1YCC9_9FLAO|nr:TonB-dependent receptor [Moheibacter sediminis]SMC33870.1 Outer membrane receptor proteins, mostly Fe transport [Moheibacter sediminis]
MYKSICLFLFLTAFTMLSAQSEGIIFGNVKDDTGAPVENADVFIDGTMYSVFTDASGNYELEVEPSAYVLIITGIGFDEFSQEVTVNAGERVEVSTQLISSSTSTTQLGEAVVVGQVSKETESALLNEQRKSVVITESIGVKELERKGVSDVSSAVTKVSGISKQEGSSVVYVRGLGDRYNSTTMNGLPIPSNDPEWKNIDLSILSTDILSYIGIDKVYSGTFFGDFAGGNVNVNSKKQTGKGFFSFGMTSRINTNAIKDNTFRLQQGINWMGFDKVSNPNSLTQYGFENSLNPKKSGALGAGFSLAAGERFNVGENGKFSFFVTGTHDNDYSSIEDGFLRTGINTEGLSQGRDFPIYRRYDYTTNTTGYLNLSYQLNRKNTINFNSLFVNSSNQKLEEGEGWIRDVAIDGGQQRRGTYVQNILWVNQLLGEHKLGERSNLNWAFGYNKVTSDLPDRFQNTLKFQNGNYVMANNAASDNHRYYHDLSEDEYVGNIAVDYKFAKSEDGYKGKITLGYNGRYKERDLNALQYNFRVNAEGANVPVDFANIDAFYNQENFNNNWFDMVTFSGDNLSRQYYNGEQNIQGGYANIEYKLTPKFTAVIGLRGEMVNQLVGWNTSLDPVGRENELEEFMFLPSLNLKYEVTDRQNIRFAASKTYTLPQFKERALFMYEEFDGTTVGNPSTYASTDYNADLKWEIFPNAGELISVAAFGKYILDPINKFTMASSSNDLTYGNTGDWGYVFGGELEVRKSIFKIESNNPLQLTAGANVSYAYSNQELNPEKLYDETLLANGYRITANFTDEEAAFQGASDLLLNGDISINKEWEGGEMFMATLAYNYFSDRIFALGVEERGNIIEKGIGTLDFIIRTKVSKNIGINLNARNLLNPTFERFQENKAGDVTNLSYKKGMNFSLNVNYQF